jgi:hypothetical protein
LKLTKTFFIERGEDEIEVEVSLKYSDDALEDIEYNSEPLTTDEIGKVSKMVEKYDWHHDACIKVREKREYAASVYADRRRAELMGK